LIVDDATNLDQLMNKENWLQEREKQLAKCCWNDDMEREYQLYEAECRLNFGDLKLQNHEKSLKVVSTG
jgi:hypothetical protein